MTGLALASFLALAQAARADAPARPPITLEVDATDVRRGIVHAHLLIPAAPGPVSLAYPKWIPGEHAPDGPITQVVNLRLSAGGQALVWRRDPLDAFSFRVDVPAGASTIDASFDFLSPPRPYGDGYGKTPNVTPHLVVLPFNHVVLYPAGAPTDEIPVRASVRLPPGWKFDTALRAGAHVADTVQLPTVSLTTLVDSPLLAGEHFRTVALSEGAGAARLSIAADHPAALGASEAQVAGFRRVVSEAQALFGARHYKQYVWLVALGERLDRNGLEHHESTDIRGAEAFFTDPAIALRWAGLLPHEYVHSWNGKYRRPAGLATPDYQTPMKDDLLWVYEGLTRYLGDLLLTARAGLRTAEDTREYVAWVAASLQSARPGRAWRPLADTAAALPGYNEAPGEWASIRRARDYYDEMLLVWLEADTIVRRESGGSRSLDDFCRRFFGAGDGAPEVRAYTRDDLLAALQEVAPHDWRAFFAERVDAVRAQAPLGGLAAAGWTLVYDDRPNAFLAARAREPEAADLSFSLGLAVRPDGTVADVVYGGPAFAAGVAPAMRVSAIGGQRWSPAAATAALRRAEASPDPIEMVVEMGDDVRVVHLDHHGGERHPHLERDPSRPDLLAAILAPRAP